MRRILVLTVTTLALTFPALAQFKEGKYRVEAEMQGMPGMPPGMGKQVLEQCFTKKDTEDPVAAMQKEGSCKVLKSTRTNDRFSAELTCDGRPMSFDFRSTAGGFEGETQMEISDGGQKHKMTVKSKGTRLGAC